MVRKIEIVVVGSGFAGSLAARVLARLGRRVLLVERGRHPRFALGESSTPLAAISLESLAERFGLPDLRALAAYGRWLAAFPEVRRGLKRGFTFYGHGPGRPWAEGGAPRLLVAASPDDRVADSHWLRRDVDHFLLRRAIGEGVEYLDRTRLASVEIASRGRAGIDRAGRVGGEAGVVLAGERRGRPIEIRADFVIDASGGGGFLAGRLPIASALDRVPVASACLYGHFRGVLDFAEIAREETGDLRPGPYPDDRAAVHHLLDLGWMYQLGFDHGVTSAGFLLDLTHPEVPPLLAEFGHRPAEIFRRLVARQPSLARQFTGARAVRPVALISRIQHRAARAAGPGWLLLPSAYCSLDPLFSTGIAWSLAGVERVGSLFADGGPPDPERLAAYEKLLSDEADHLGALVRGAYLARADWRLFVPQSLLYFAAASFAEASRRLRPESRDWTWEGFLGARDQALAGTRAAPGHGAPCPDDNPGIDIDTGSRNVDGGSGTAAEAVARLATLLAAGRRPTDAECAAFADWIAATIAPRNVAGLADPARGDLYPVDFAPLVAGAGLLGMTPDEVRAAFPRLRGLE